MKYIMETDRLRLRRFELSDAEELYKHNQFTMLRKQSYLSNANQT